MNATKLKSEISAAVKEIAAKHNANVHVDKVERSGNELETTVTFVEQKQEEATSTTTKRRKRTRKQQVRALMDRGIEGARKIAKKIGTHQSYVSRLINEIKQEDENQAMA